jgi:putative solute:sodium symporter small subunit
MNKHAAALHWRRTQRLTAVLLALWLVLIVASIVFARDLAQLHLFGWPLSSYLAGQGILLVFVAIVGVYAWQMQRIDRAAAPDAPPNPERET